MSAVIKQKELGKLGEKLQKARIEKGFELDDIQHQTKISHRNLRAMEEGNYKELPAFSFCRGFYKMYASAVGLNPETIVKQFEEEYIIDTRNKKSPVFRFEKQNKEVEMLAERPALWPFSSLGFILLILLLFVAFLSWFFSWNPASFLSQRLRKLSPPQQYELPRSTTSTSLHNTIEDIRYVQVTSFSFNCPTPGPARTERTPFSS